MLTHLTRRFLPPIEADEWRPLLLAFAWFFCVLLSYYLIRPVRETLGSVLGRNELLPLFTATFTVMVLANPIYSFLIAKLPRRVLALIVYAFFALCLFVFWLFMNTTISTWTARAFFVWVSVFNLFAVSLFWSFLADTFSSEQAKRLFGFVAAGGTLGGLTGSFLAQELVGRVGMAQLLLVPMGAIGVVAILMLSFDRAARQMKAKTEVAVSEEDQPTGGTFWEGITHVMQSPYLMGICGALILAKLCGTTGYFQQTEIVSETLADNEMRIRLFARMNIAVQVVTIILQTLFVGRLMRWWGLSAVLCILPLTYAASFLGLGMTSTLAMLVIGRVAQRGMAYGLMVPAQETLFTVVSREDKYKSKGFIDTAITRGGDVLASLINDWLFRLGLALQAVAFGMIPATLVWCGISWWLGRQQVLRAKYFESEG